MARWTATETRTIEAFALSDNALKNTSFRIHPDMPFTDDRIYWLEPDRLPEQFTPEFSLALDLDALADETLIDPNDLDLVFILRDNGIHRWEVMQRFRATQSPESWAPDPFALAGFALPHNLKFLAMIVPSGRIEYRPGRAYLPQHVVAETAFEVRLQRDGARFPVRVEEESWFVANNLPRDTVWATRWTGSPSDRAAAEALTIVVNKRYEESLQRILASADVGGAYGAFMATEIFAEVCKVALEDASEYAVDESTLQAIVQARLGIRSQEELELFKNGTADASEGLALLRGYAQSTLSMGDAITKARVR